MTQVEIISTKNGWALRVNGLYIHGGYGRPISIKAIENNNGGKWQGNFVPAGATQWISIPAVREFWNEYKHWCVCACDFPYMSISGNLVNKFGEVK